MPGLQCRSGCKAPRLERVLAKIAREGGNVALLEGPLIPTQRRTGLPMRRRWSAKHKRHGLLVIALTDVRGWLLWTSTTRLARSSKITACRHDGLVGRLRAAGLAAIADLGFVSLDDGGPDTDTTVITGYKKPKGKKLPRYVFRGPARGPLASGPGMTVPPCRADDLGGGVTGPGRRRWRR
ncbi:transposase family protein [Streptomyces albogriseolus]|uniref:transposase family protein n=1 Tax=Streptomyces albogriseolus TaxID=1887 RepID=UPI0033BB3D97